MQSPGMGSDKENRPPRMPVPKRQPLAPIGVPDVDRSSAQHRENLEQSATQHFPKPRVEPRGPRTSSSTFCELRSADQIRLCDLFNTNDAISHDWHVRFFPLRASWGSGSVREVRTYFDSIIKAMDAAYGKQLNDVQRVVTEHTTDEEFDRIISDLADGKRITICLCLSARNSAEPLLAHLHNRQRRTGGLTPQNQVEAKIDELYRRLNQLKNPMNLLWVNSNYNCVTTNELSFTYLCARYPNLHTWFTILLTPEAMNKLAESETIEDKFRQSVSACFEKRLPDLYMSLFSCRLFTLAATGLEVDSPEHRKHVVGLAIYRAILLQKKRDSDGKRVPLNEACPFFDVFRNHIPSFNASVLGARSSGISRCFDCRSSVSTHTWRRVGGKLHCGCKNRPADEPHYEDEILCASLAYYTALELLDVQDRSWIDHYLIDDLVEKVKYFEFPTGTTCNYTGCDQFALHMDGKCMFTHEYEDLNLL